MRLSLVQRDEWNSRRRDVLSYPDIPDAELFQGRSGSFEKPVTVHGWEWSTTFGRWAAVCTFADGWHGVTYPKTW
jgi:hypothetical protein